MVLRADFVEIFEIHTYPPLILRLRHQDRIGQPHKEVYLPDVAGF